MTNMEVLPLLSMKLDKPIVEGKSKKIYLLTNDICFMVFKPHLRSITSKREENIEGTEEERLTACLYFMTQAEKHGIPTQLLYDKIVEIDGETGIIVKKVNTIPIEFISRYYAAGSIVRLYPSLVKEGQKFRRLLYKFDLKQDIVIAGVDDPTLNENYIVGLDILTQSEFDTAKNMLADISDMINEDLASKSIKLIDMKMEFGFDSNHQIVLIDEISQDCIRANDMSTDESLTKDAFRNMKTDEEVLNAYKAFNARVCI